MKDSFDITPPDEEDNHQTILFLNTLPRIGKFVKPEQQSELPDTHDPVLKGKLDITSSDQDEILKQMIRQNTNLMRAVEAGNLTSVERSILEGAQINAHCGAFHITALHLAAYLGYTHILSYLLQNGANANAEDKMGRTGIYLAATTGSKECMQLLINAKADINRKVHVPTTHKSPRATWPGDMEENTFQPYALEFAKIAIGSNLLPFPDCLGRAPLHQAVKGGHSECVQILLNAGANVNEEDDKYLTPLLLAGAGVVPEDKGAVQRYETIVKLLVQGGASVNALNVDTRATALHYAASIPSLGATRCLISAGAYVTLQGKDGMTPLHEAAKSGFIPVVMELLRNDKSGRLVNCRDNIGRTPMHKAAYNGDRDCLKLLLDHGGNLVLETKAGISVIDAIFLHIPRPVDFLKDVFDSQISTNSVSINDRSFKIMMDFRFLVPKSTETQMCVLEGLISSGEEDQLIKLLQHPLIETFLRMKWRKLRHFFFLLVVLYACFVILLSSFVILEVYHSDWNSTSNKTVHEDVDESLLCNVIYHIRIILFSVSGMIIMYTCCQIWIIPRHYLRDYESWLLMACSTLSILVAYYDTTVLPLAWKHMASIAVFLAWAELMLLVGRFPTWGYYSLMFSTVLKNVVKVLLTFVSLVIGFSLSFFVQFYNGVSFEDPWRSFVKTMVMAMGEFDYTEMFHNERTHLSYTSRIIFVVFVFLASIALMNLLVGLAVSDIQGLQVVGHVLRLIKQAHFISHLEKLTSHRWNKVFPKSVQSFFEKRRLIPLYLSIQPSMMSLSSPLSPFRLPYELLDNIIQTALKQEARNYAHHNQWHNVCGDMEKLSKEYSKMKLYLNDVAVNSEQLMPMLTNINHELNEIKSMLVHFIGETALRSNIPCGQENVRKHSELVPELQNAHGFIRRLARSKIYRASNSITS